MELTSGERTYLNSIKDRINNLSSFLTRQPSPSATTEVAEWYTFLAALKEILGNASNGVSFVATVMAKQYLMRTLPLASFDAASKPQGAPGLDIDEKTVDGKRVIAEIKTTVPYLGSELGAQKAAFKKDFEKLKSAQADYKFFFVTEPSTFEVVKRRYSEQLQGVTVVLLTTGEEYWAHAVG